MSQRATSRSPLSALTLRRLFLLAASCLVGAVGWFLLGESEALSAEQEVAQSAALERHSSLNDRFVLGIRSELLDLEARRRGLSHEDLLRAEVYDCLAEIPQAEVDAFYASRRALLRRPQAEAEPRIREHLAYEALFERLEARHLLPASR